MIGQGAQCQNKVLVGHPPPAQSLFGDEIGPVAMVTVEFKAAVHTARVHLEVPSQVIVRFGDGAFELHEVVQSRNTEASQKNQRDGCRHKFARREDADL